MVKLSTQKKILLILVLNCSILFIWWFYNIHKIHNSEKFKLTGIYMMAGVAISTVIYIVSYYIHAYIPIKQPFWDIAIFYILSLIVLSFIIRCQRRLGVE